MLFWVLRDRNTNLITPKKQTMRTLNNLFGKCESAKNIIDFTQFSLSNAKMVSIKGGTDPIEPEPEPCDPPIKPL